MTTINVITISFYKKDKIPASLTKKSNRQSYKHKNSKTKNTVHPA